jgi:hypothetical protein
MKLISGLLSVLMLVVSCAHYNPVQYVGGQRNADGASFETCTNYLLTFPIDAKASTIEYAISANGLKENEIYSIEQSLWHYLWPLFSQTCVNLNANTNYKRTAPEPVVNINPLPRMEIEPGVFTTGDPLKDAEVCEKYTSLARGNCRKKIHNYYEDLKKNKESANQ